MTRLACLAAFLVLAACAREEEPVANRYDRTSAEIENKARALEADVENQVRGVEADVQHEIDALANQQNSTAPVETEVPPAAANAPAMNRSR